MKPVPTADHSVRVRPLDQEVPGPSAPLYAGAYDVTLNGRVTVVVVPQTPVPVDQWDPDVLPDDLDAIDDVGLARLAAALCARYVVTAGDVTGGEITGVRPFRSLGDGPDERTGVALVVDRAELPALAADLADLATFLGAVVPEQTLASLRGRPAIERIVELQASMAPADARWLRDG